MPVLQGTRYADGIVRAQACLTGELTQGNSERTIFPAPFDVVVHYFTHRVLYFSVLYQHIVNRVDGCMEHMPTQLGEYTIIGELQRKLRALHKHACIPNASRCDNELHL